MSKPRDLISAFLGALVGVWLTIRLIGSVAPVWHMVIILVISSFVIFGLQVYTKGKSLKERSKNGSLLFVGSLLGGTLFAALLNPDATIRGVFTSTDFLLFALIPVFIMILLEICERC